MQSLLKLAFFQCMKLSMRKHGHIRIYLNSELITFGVHLAQILVGMARVRVEVGLI